jgi:hypothetical protein
VVLSRNCPVITALGSALGGSHDVDERSREANGEVKVGLNEKLEPRLGFVLMVMKSRHISCVAGECWGIYTR